MQTIYWNMTIKINTFLKQRLKVVGWVLNYT